ncbi:MAG: hypothetical protein ABI587_01765 [Gemmatimonadales bacterium]
MQLSLLPICLVAGFGFPLVASAQTTAAPGKYPVLQAYDPTSDSTTRSVEVQRGRYFLHFHKPRVAVALAYRGREAPAEPDSVLIEFRTQSPQYTATNVLTLTGPGDLHLLAAATRSRVHTHIQTTDHTLTFVLPAAELRPLLTTTKARLEVGGVKVDLKRDQLAALEALLGSGSAAP